MKDRIYLNQRVKNREFRGYKTLPRHGFGAFLKDNASGIGSAAGFAGGLASGLLPQDKPGLTGGVTGALSGAAAGSQLGLPGIIGGAAIGGIMGVINGKKQKAAEETLAMNMEKDRVQKQQAMRFDTDRASLSTFPTEGVSGVNYYAANGGFIAPQYLAEGGEVIEHGGEDPEAFNGALSEISNNMSMIQGQSHAGPDDGVEMSGGEFIYSNRMKSSKYLLSDIEQTLGKKFSKGSYAELAQKIGKIKSDAEEVLENSKFAPSLNTAKLNLERAEEALELIKFEQEYRKK